MDFVRHVGRENPDVGATVRTDGSARVRRLPQPAHKTSSFDIDLFFDYKRQKGKVGRFDLVDVKEPSRSSSTMTRAFCQLSAAARLVLPPVPPYERYRGIGSYDGCAR
jgi:hypothetical protein